jgi:RNA recognition motif-containing protein
MSSPNTVYVKNISTATSEKEIKEFFSFCGKITSIQVEKTSATSQEAVVTFEKPTAAKTALLLDHTQLGANQVSVSTTHQGDDSDDHHYTSNDDRDSDEITQEEKPRSRIIAEYLAHGYVISDAATQRAIELDQKHGVSDRFLSTLQKIDQKYNATDKAKGVDQTYGITQKATGVASSLFNTVMSYYEKAADTPTGQKLVNFYTQTSRQVVDVHNEAKRLAELKKKDAGGAEAATQGMAQDAKASAQQAAGSAQQTAADYGVNVPVPTGTGQTTCKCGSNSEKCPCPPGKCGCTNCAKSDVQTVPGTAGQKTTCGCGGDKSKCGCEDGHCACSACPKSASNLSAHQAATQNTTITDSTKIQPLEPTQKY